MTGIRGSDPTCPYCFLLGLAGRMGRIGMLEFSHGLRSLPGLWSGIDAIGKSRQEMDTVPVCQGRSTEDVKRSEGDSRRFIQRLVECRGELTIPWGQRASVLLS